jgi:hypothetical protein
MRRVSPVLTRVSHSMGRLAVIHVERCAFPAFQAAL